MRGTGQLRRFSLDGSLTCEMFLGCSSSFTAWGLICIISPDLWPGAELGHSAAVSMPSFSKQRYDLYTYKLCVWFTSQNELQIDGFRLRTARAGGLSAPSPTDCGRDGEYLLADSSAHLLREQVFFSQLLPGGGGAVSCFGNDGP